VAGAAERGDPDRGAPSHRAATRRATFFLTLLLPFALPAVSVSTTEVRDLRLSALTAPLGSLITSFLTDSARTAPRTGFSVNAFEEVRRKKPRYWASPRNDMARGIYSEAMREKQRLAGASDELLAAELRAIRLAR